MSTSHFSSGMEAGAVSVCFDKDIVCGDLPQNWCLGCPKRGLLQVAVAPHAAAHNGPTAMRPATADEHRWLNRAMRRASSVVEPDRKLGMRVAIIPARGGSVRIPRKNIREFRGFPMLLYPLMTAVESKLFDLIVVSTDDDEIASLAFKAGATVVPRATDDGTTGTQEIAARVLETLGINGGETCVVYATSPLLLVDDLKAGHAALLNPSLKCYAMSVGPDGQDAGCFYFGWTRAFRDRRPLDDTTTAKVTLPAERVCDVNTPSDWARAEQLFNALRRAP